MLKRPLISSMPPAVYVTPPPEPSDDPPEPWDHAAFTIDSHFDRQVAPPREFLAQLEVEGYSVWPGLLPPPLLAALREQVSRYETTPRDYSSRQRGCPFAGPAPFIDPSLKTYDYQANPLAELIGHEQTVSKLTEIFGSGSPPVFISYAYDISCVGTPGISLHTDMQPYGSSESTTNLPLKMTFNLI